MSFSALASWSRKLGPRSPGYYIDRGLESHPWEGPREQELRLGRAREQTYEALIEKLDGIASAYVTITRAKARSMATPGTVKAMVMLDIEGERTLPYATIKAIQNMLVGSEPDLKPDAVERSAEGYGVRIEHDPHPSRANLKAEGYQWVRFLVKIG